MAEASPTAAPKQVAATTAHSRPGAGGPRCHFDHASGPIYDLRLNPYFSPTVSYVRVLRPLFVVPRKRELRRGAGAHHQLARFVVVRLAVENFLQAFRGAPSIFTIDVCVGGEDEGLGPTPYGRRGERIQGLGG